MATSAAPATETMVELALALGMALRTAPGASAQGQARPPMTSPRLALATVLMR